MDPEDKYLAMAATNSESYNHGERSSASVLFDELAAHLAPAPSPAAPQEEIDSTSAQEYVTLQSPHSLDADPIFIRMNDFFRRWGCMSPEVPAAESSHTTPSLSTGSTPDASPALATPPASSALPSPLPSFYDCGDYQPHVHTGIVASPEGNVPTLPHSIPAPELGERELNDEDIRHKPASDVIACEWDGGCGHHGHYLEMWLHIFGTGKKNVAEPIAGKHLDGTESAILCLWNGCESKLPMRSDSLKRHIQAQHLFMTVECTWCNVNRREDAYKTTHRPARFCEHRPTDEKKRDEIWARRPPAAVPSTALPSAAGPVRPKRTRAPRKKAQKAIAYPSPTDVAGSILHQGRRGDQRSIRPRPVAGPSSSSRGLMSTSAFLPFEPAQASFRAPQQSHSMVPQVVPTFVQGSSTGRGTGPTSYPAPIAPAPMPSMYGYSSIGSDRAAGRSFSQPQLQPQPQPQYFDQPTVGPSYFQMNAPAPVPTRRPPMQRRAPLQPAASAGLQGPPMGQMDLFTLNDFIFPPAANPMPQYTADAYKDAFDPFSMWPASDAENQPPYFGAPF